MRKIGPKQKLTVSLNRETVQRAKLIAAKWNMAISDLVARQLELLVDQEQSYESARRRALALLDEGLRLGGIVRANRDDLHYR